MSTNTQELANTELTYSERFTNMVIREFSSRAGGVTLTNFQKKLCQNYFIRIDSTLKEAEAKRLKKNEQYRDALSYSWDNVNMEKLSLDVIAYSSVGLDPMQPNHINLIPYKNHSLNKYDFGFIIGYKGTEIKSVKYGLDVPEVVIVELVRANDTFKEMKRDIHNKHESYVFKIENSFDRGDIIGGFYFHQYTGNPEKNKIKTFTKNDIDKRKPKNASAEFWGGEKDEWNNGQKTGQKIQIEGWYEEMAYKTLYKSAYNAITIDSEKIDEHYLAIIQKDNDFAQEKVEKEIHDNSNKKEISFEPTAETIKTIEVVSEEVKTEKVEQPESKQSQTTGPGF